MWRSQIRHGLLAASALAGLAVAQADSARGQAQSTLVASGLSQPLYATAPAGDTRLFVVEEAGRIRIVKSGAPLMTAFLDIHSQVSTSGEGGLLGMAFPSDYATSGLFYVYYTNLDSDSVVSRFSVSGNPDEADAGSEEQLLFIDQPDDATNHRGGTIHFGPDGFLWFATGDGGPGNDPNERAQDEQSLLGKMLRIDVGPVFAPDSIDVGECYLAPAVPCYLVPADNPFVGSTTTRKQIWALGFRNPFRWSFDRTTGNVWIGDVGQSLREEVDFESASDPGGNNYGWDVMEGTDCNDNDPAPEPPCNDPSLTLPRYEYDHSADNCSIIGGFVYRADISVLRGLYFFGDYCTGRVWTLNPFNLAVVERTAELGAAAGAAFNLVGFGEDGIGRLLLVHRSAGAIYRIVPPPSPPPGCGLGPELVLAVLALAGLRRARRGWAP